MHKLISLLLLFGFFMAVVAAHKSPQPPKYKDGVHVDPNGVPPINEDVRAQMPRGLSLDETVDKCRLLTPPGPGLKSFPSVQEFIFTRSLKYSGLQVLFMADTPRLECFRDKEMVFRMEIGDLSVDEIHDLLISMGVEKK
eukprot:TRINITY_DN691_c0_g4_i3.p1 TRINITY_DN691_c0_g4~~TRINITY_DN691_c0_g4_i3.p1  ORF type:complete len:140 (-),score=53.10 TRINITY_DN691_c0_g4_i3:229-648(-)